MIGALIDPVGFILHGTQSGITSPKRREYERTIQYVRDGAVDSQGTPLGWNCTISEDRYCIHAPVNQWGWNARGHSSRYVAVEFAQSVVDEIITDLQIDMFIYYLHAECAAVPRVFVMHSELEAGIADGKTDAAKIGVQANALRARIVERIAT